MSGHHSRFISPNIPLNALISDDMVHILNIYMSNDEISPQRWCELACLAKCWNDFHHTMRQLKPFDWFEEDKFLNACKILDNVFHQDTEFDVRIKKNSPLYENTTLHARAHAFSQSSGIYHIIWSNEISHMHRLNASIRASLNENNTTATIINIRQNIIQKITVNRPQLFIEKLIY